MQECTSLVCVLASFSSVFLFGYERIVSFYLRLPFYCLSDTYAHQHIALAQKAMTCCMTITLLPNNLTQI